MCILLASLKNEKQLCPPSFHQRLVCAHLFFGVELACVTFTLCPFVPCEKGDEQWIHTSPKFVPPSCVYNDILSSYIYIFDRLHAMGKCKAGSLQGQRSHIFIKLLFYNQPSLHLDGVNTCWMAVHIWSSLCETTTMLVFCTVNNIPISIMLPFFMVQKHMTVHTGHGCGLSTTTCGVTPACP